MNKVLRILPAILLTASLGACACYDEPRDDVRHSEVRHERYSNTDYNGMNGESDNGYASTTTSHEVVRQDGVRNFSR